MPRRRSATDSRSAHGCASAEFQRAQDANNSHRASRPGVAAALPTHRTTRACLMANEAWPSPALPDRG